MRLLSEDRSRLITDEDAALAIVGYVGGVRDDGFWRGDHAGCFWDEESAQRWLVGVGGPDYLMPYSVGGTGHAARLGQG